MFAFIEVIICWYKHVMILVVTCDYGLETCMLKVELKCIMQYVSTAVMFLDVMYSIMCLVIVRVCWIRCCGTSGPAGL